jgi:transcriptional regulator with XRE-family HTH domain
MKLTEREELVILRKRKNLTLKDISEEIGCSISLLSKFEKNRCELSPEKFKKYKSMILS